MSRRFSDVSGQALRRRYTGVPPLDDETAGFCRLVAAADPVFVPVRVEQQAKPLMCFWNVRDKVARDGGDAVFGWAIVSFPSAYWKAQHHAIWRSPEGELVDVTPPVYSDLARTLFVADESAELDWETPIVLPLKRSGVPLAEVQAYLAFKRGSTTRGSLCSPDGAKTTILGCESCYAARPPLSERC